MRKARFAQPSTNRAGLSAQVAQPRVLLSGYRQKHTADLPVALRRQDSKPRSRHSRVKNSLDRLQPRRTKGGFRR